MQSLRSLLPSPAALIPLLLALLVIVPAPDLKAAEDGLAGSSLVDPALLQALNESERVGARVYYLEAEGFDEPINQSTLNREVSPVLIELASAFLPGELKPVESMLAWGVGGVVNTDVVRGLVTNPNVLWIELDETAEIESAPKWIPSSRVSQPRPVPAFRGIGSVSRWSWTVPTGPCGHRVHSRLCSHATRAPIGRWLPRF